VESAKKGQFAVEIIFDKIAEIEQNTGLDIWACLLAVIIIAAIIWFLRWGFKAFSD
jgi:hypothetical protein